MTNSRIDHITVIAADLDAGDAWVQQHLGVRPDPGGKHPRMGTHNRLLRLGDAMFLEVIAVDPDAARPERPRWFALDHLAAGCPPRLGCWVARTDNIGSALAGASEPLGPAEPMTRGALQWRISIPADGSLPLGGTAPALIQWLASSHPALGMRDLGCRLVGLALQHPEPARVRRLLGSLGLAEPGVAVSVETAAATGLVAHIQTPQGLRSLC